MPPPWKKFTKFSICNFQNENSYTTNGPNGKLCTWKDRKYWVLFERYWSFWCNYNISGWNFKKNVKYLFFDFETFWLQLRYYPPKQYFSPIFCTYLNIQNLGFLMIPICWVVVSKFLGVNCIWSSMIKSPRFCLDNSCHSLTRSCFSQKNVYSSLISKQILLILGSLKSWDFGLFFGVRWGSVKSFLAKQRAVKKRTLTAKLLFPPWSSANYSFSGPYPVNLPFVRIQLLSMEQN